MTAAGSYQHPQRITAGRSTPHHSSTRNYSSPAEPQKSLATRLNNESRAGANSSSSSSSTSRSQQHSGSRLRAQQPRNLDSNMSSYGSTVTTQARANGHAKLHKRGGSGSSLPGPPSPLVHSQFATPFATYEEPFPDLSATPPTSSTPKIKPYLRKMSSAKQEDQGRLDLSKSTLENDRLAGLGIQDFGVRSAQDVSFAHAARRGTHGHARTTSVGSQASAGSGSYKPNVPFIHPMRQMPRPYTPPTGSSNASFVNEDEANESDDVVDDDYRLGSGFRSKRSMSISSVPAVAPTPLSQSHTAEDLGYVPKLTSVSQTNLSIKSGRSGKSGRSKLGRPRRDTGRSFDVPTSPSSRNSFDKAFSFVSRKSDTEPQTRDERIREARRKFEEREAHKVRKNEREALKRRETDEAKSAKKHERQRRTSDVRVTKQEPRSSPRKGRPAEGADEVHDHESEKLRARSYDETRAANQPRRGREAGMSEKQVHRVQERKAHNPQSGWVRFSAWLQTRMLSCGGGR